MELLQLKYFRDAVLTGNFSHTATKFSVPPSAVSQSVKRLEKELGTTLFERRANKIVPNESGKVLFNRINVALSEIDRGVEDVKSITSEYKGKITLLIESNRRYITECISRFKSRYPFVDFAIYHQRLQGESVKFDLVVSSLSDFGAGWEKEFLLKEDILLSVSKDSPLASKKEVGIRELSSTPFVSMPAGSNLHKLLIEVFEPYDLLPNITIFCDDPYYVRRYTEMGLGASLYPEFSWRGQVSCNVVNIPFSEKVERVTYLYSRAGNSAIVETFKSYLKG